MKKGFSGKFRFKDVLIKEGFKGFDFIPAPVIEKKQIKLSEDLFLLKPKTILDFKVVRGKGEDGFGIPQYFEKEMREYLHNDFLISDGDLYFSKRLYLFLKAKYADNISHEYCFQVK